MTGFFISCRKEIKVKQFHLPINLKPLCLECIHFLLYLIHITLFNLLKEKFENINLQLKALLISIMMAIIRMIITIRTQILLFINPTLQLRQVIIINNTIALKFIKCLQISNMNLDITSRSKVYVIRLYLG